MKFPKTIRKLSLGRVWTSYLVKRFGIELWFCLYLTNIDEKKIWNCCRVSSSFWLTSCSYSIGHLLSESWSFDVPWIIFAIRSLILSLKNLSVLLFCCACDMATPLASCAFLSCMSSLNGVWTLEWMKFGLIKKNSGIAVSHTKCHSYLVILFISLNLLWKLIMSTKPSLTYKCITTVKILL